MLYIPTWVDVMVTLPTEKYNKTRTSEVLHLTYSAVKASIKRTEEQAGGKLLEGNNPAYFTPLGTQVHKLALTIKAEMEAFNKVIVK